MSTDSQISKLEEARASLDRHLGFFPKVEAKSMFLIGLNSAILTALALNINWATGCWFPLSIALLSVTFVVLAFVDLYRAQHPHLSGPENSLLYFGSISKLTLADFREQLATADDTSLLDDYVGQIWINARILELKFRRVERAFVFTALSLVCAFGYLIVESIISGNPPSF